MRDIEQQRTSRSDEGIIALTDAVFKDVFGLNEETISRIKRMIRNQGQWLKLKQTVRTMSGVAYRRLNDVITMSQQRVDAEASDDEMDDNFTNDVGADDHPDFDHAEHNFQDRGTEFNRGTRENKMTFAGYLLTELQYSDEDLRDPAKRQEVMRMMRSSDAQAQQLVNRGEKEQKQDQRLEVQQETDPRKATLRRRKQALQRQIMQIDNELGEGGEEEPTV